MRQFEEALTKSLAGLALPFPSHSLSTCVLLGDMLVLAEAHKSPARLQVLLWTLQLQKMGPAVSKQLVFYGADNAPLDLPSAMADTHQVQLQRGADELVLLLLRGGEQDMVFALLVGGKQLECERVSAYKVQVRDSRVQCVRCFPQFPRHVFLASHSEVWAVHLFNRIDMPEVALDIRRLYQSSGAAWGRKLIADIVVPQTRLPEDLANFALFVLFNDGAIIAISPLALEDTLVPRGQRHNYEAMARDGSGVAKDIAQEVVREAKQFVNLKPNISDYSQILTVHRAQVQSKGSKSAIRNNRYARLWAWPMTVGVLLLVGKRSGPRGYCSFRVLYSLSKIGFEAPSFSLVYKFKLNNLADETVAPQVLLIRNSQCYIRTAGYVYRFDLQPLIDLDRNLASPSLLESLAASKAKLQLVLQPSPGVPGYWATFIHRQLLLLLRKQEDAIAVYSFDIEAGQESRLQRLAQDYNELRKKYQQFVRKPALVKEAGELTLSALPSEPVAEALFAWEKAFFAEIDRFIVRFQDKYGRLLKFVQQAEQQRKTNIELSRTLEGVYQRVKQKGDRLGALAREVGEGGEQVAEEEAVQLRRRLAVLRQRLKGCKAALGSVEGEGGKQVRLIEEQLAELRIRIK